MNPGEAVKMDSEYKSFLAELGGPQPPAFDAAPQRGRCSCRLGHWQARITKACPPCCSVCCPLCHGSPCNLFELAGLHGRIRPGDELPDSCKLYVGNLSQASKPLAG